MHVERGTEFNIGCAITELLRVYIKVVIIAACLVSLRARAVACLG